MKNRTGKEIKSDMDYAKIAMEKARDALCLGSSNISKSSYDHHLDKPLIVGGLFSSNDSKRRLNFEALNFEVPTIIHKNNESRFNFPSINKVEELSNKRIGQMIVEGAYPYHQSNPEKSSLQNRLDLALTAQGGNCSDLAICTLAILRQEGYKGRIELVTFAAFDHAFLIINRPTTSSLDGWKSWGSESIIIDPWINEICRGDQFAELWNDKLKILLKGGFLSPTLDFPEEKLKSEVLLRVELIAENPSIEITQVKSQFKS
jgi:hypothetical protein